MLFNSYIFILLFLPLCLFGYFALNHKQKYKLGQAYLLGMSLWFYAYFHVSYLAVIGCSVLVNFCLYRLLQTNRQQRVRKGFLIFGVLLNLGALGYFKYMDFFIENINAVFHSHIQTLGILLPLGISFFTFQQISFLVDAYHGEIPAYGFLEYAGFVTFFPQLVAGPIVTHDELVPQFQDLSKKKFSYEDLAQGIYIFTLGLAKKKLLADTFGDAVTYGYTTLAQLSTASAFLVMLAYTLQIYFDFSGYCDMAIGIGKMFRIDLPINFNSPYKAITITQFWERWHITLTRFFTKYVYIPLGGSRKGKIRTCINVMIVFLASGLWHGASWNFVLWGAMHGIFMVIARVCKNGYTKIPAAINWVITFAFVNVAWVFFRADTLSQAVTLIKKLVIWDFAPLDPVFQEIFRLTELKKVLSVFRVESLYPPFIMTGFFVVAFCILMKKKNAYDRMQTYKPNVRNLLTTLFLLCWCVFSFAGITTFLYFNF